MDKSIKEMDLNTLITKVLADPNFRADISNKYRVTGYHGINGFEVEQCKPCAYSLICLSKGLVNRPRFVNVSCPCFYQNKFIDFHYCERFFFTILS